MCVRLCVKGESINSSSGAVLAAFFELSERVRVCVYNFILCPVRLVDLRTGVPLLLFCVCVCGLAF